MVEIKYIVCCITDYRILFHKEKNKQTYSIVPVTITNRRYVMEITAKLYEACLGFAESTLYIVNIYTVLKRHTAWQFDAIRWERLFARHKSVSIKD